jgi:glycosyltransferase involved in cell wall biosynthesis
MPTVCLALMVKNESRIIKRCLKAAYPWADSWLVCDTGSTDGTQDIIREYLMDIPGELVEVPWVDFGHNRSQVVELAKGKADYLLLLDADLGIDIPEAPYLSYGLSVRAVKESLTADAYELRYSGGLDYVNTRLVSTKFDWRYVGVTHEYITSDTARVYAELPDVRLVDFADGGNRSDKFLRDVQLLSRAVAENPSDTRSTFYLAQSFKDLAQYPAAAYWYGWRAAMVLGFDEERWYAMYQQGRMALLGGEPWEKCRSLFLKAYEYRPTRIEPIYEIVKHYREAGNDALAFTYASVWGHGFAYPRQDRLFIDTNIYRHLMPYEFAFAALKVRKLRLAEEWLARLTRDSLDTPWMRPWIETLKAMASPV